MSFRAPLFVAFALCATGVGLADESAAPSVPVQPKLAYGQMARMGDKLVFAPCRDRSYTMLEDVSPGGTLTHSLEQIGLAEGKKLYVELWAVLEGGALRASGLNMAQQEGRCQQPGLGEESWRATGSDPAWLLALGTEKAVLKRPEQPDALLPMADVNAADGGAQMVTSDATHRLSLTFSPELCHDQARAAIYGWRAQVDLDGKVLNGCAWQR